MSYATRPDRERRAALATLGERYGVSLDGDYEREHMPELANGGCPRYGAVHGDDEHTYIHLAETVEAACRILEDGVTNLYPSRPLAIHDLDSGEQIEVRPTVTPVGAASNVRLLPNETADSDLIGPSQTARAATRSGGYLG